MYAHRLGRNCFIATAPATNGDRFTTLKDRRKEIGPGLLKAMLDQLGLTKEDLDT